MAVTPGDRGRSDTGQTLVAYVRGQVRDDAARGRGDGGEVPEGLHPVLARPPLGVSGLGRLQPTLMRGPAAGVIVPPVVPAVVGVHHLAVEGTESAQGRGRHGATAVLPGTAGFDDLPYGAGDRIEDRAAGDARRELGLGTEPDGYGSVVDVGPDLAAPEPVGPVLLVRCRPEAERDPFASCRDGAVAQPDALVVQVSVEDPDQCEVPLGGDRVAPDVGDEPLPKPHARGRDTVAPFVSRRPEGPVGVLAQMRQEHVRGGHDPAGRDEEAAAPHLGSARIVIRQETDRGRPDEGVEAGQALRHPSRPVAPRPVHPAARRG